MNWSYVLSILQYCFVIFICVFCIIIMLPMLCTDVETFCNSGLLKKKDFLGGGGVRFRWRQGALDATWYIKKIKKNDSLSIIHPFYTERWLYTLSFNLFMFVAVKICCVSIRISYGSEIFWKYFIRNLHQNPTINSPQIFSGVVFRS